MKRTLIAVVALAMVFAAGTVVMAGDKEGTVKMIQVNERVITLSDGSQLVWTEAYQVPAEIKEGTKVKATYEPKDGKMVLKKIEVIK
jgi:uncharacterized protein (AIM24 family)